MSQGFIQIPRSLLDHPTVVSAPHAQHKVLMTILYRMCFSDCQHDAHGILLNLKPGQCCFTLIHMAEWSHTTKNDVERALARFEKAGILKKIEIVKSETRVDEKVRQKVRQPKTLITITHKDTYDLLFSTSETKSETKVRQERDKSETQKDNEDNADTEDKKKKIKKEKVIQEKILIREWVSLTQVEIDKIYHLHGKELANAMLDILDSYNTSRQECYKSDYGALKTGGWVHKEALARKNQPRPYNTQGNQNAGRNQADQQNSSKRGNEDDGEFKAKRTLTF